MKYNNKINSNEWRQSFTTACLAVIALSSLLISGFNNTDFVERVGLLIVTMSSLSLMAIPLAPNLKSLRFWNKNEFTGETGVVVSTFEGEHKTIKTMTGFLPERDRITEKTEAEKFLTAELRKILETGFSLPNCGKGLDLLARHKSVVKKSWTHTLNKARLLAATRHLTEAVELTYRVIKRFSKSNEAVGIAYEVLSFIEELKEPNEKGMPYQQWLERRRVYIIEGLKFHPTGYDLLMNAFEVAVRQGNAEEALSYLERAIAVDREIVQENVKKNPLTREAMRLSPALKRTINELVKGENKIKAFEMVRVKTLILVLAITSTLGLPASFSSSKIKATPDSSVSAQSYFSGGGGTSIGVKTICLDSTGTSIG